ncbi:hypothetical protein FB645_006206 [Coemansia sp. IMI 203386]|nr:hypothetical protein FB645_006206 [Coemansia sp. IMI 203386]
MHFANTVALVAFCASTAYCAAEQPHEIRLSRLDNNSNMPVLIDVGSLVAAATQMHMDSSHQRQMESVEAPRPTANFDDVFSNGPVPKSQPANSSGGNGSQKMQTQPMRPNAPANDNHKPQQQQQGGLAPSLPDGTVVKQGTVGKITVPAREMHSGINSPASGVLIDDKKSASAKPAATAVFSSSSEVDVEVSKDEGARHTTRTVIAHQIKTTTVADDDDEDGQGDRELQSQSHRKKKDDKVIASIKSGNMDRFAGDESAAVSSGRYCSAALAAFVVVAASCL